MPTVTETQSALFPGLVIVAISWVLFKTERAFLAVDLNPQEQEVQPWSEALVHISV